MKISEPLEVVVKVCLTVATVVSIILPNAAYAQTTLPFSVTLQNLRLQLAAALKNDSKTKDLTLRDEAHCLPFPDDATDHWKIWGGQKIKCVILTQRIRENNFAEIVAVGIVFVALKPGFVYSMEPTEWGNLPRESTVAITNICVAPDCNIWNLP